MGRVSATEAERRAKPLPMGRHFAGLAARLGIDLEAVATESAAAKPTGQRYMSHAELATAKGWSDEQVCLGELVIVDRSGSSWLIVCDACGWDAAIPERKADPALRAEWLIGRAGLPDRFLSREFEKTSVANEFTRRSLWSWIGSDLLPAPALFGKPGRGKTHLLVVVLRELMVRRQRPVMFRTAPQLLSELQAAMGSPRHDEIWREAVGAPLLALDDLGAEMDTDWRADRVAALIDERYRADLPLVVTTNIAPDRWDDAFDARTASRLREMTFPLELVGEDRRTEGGAQLALAAVPNIDRKD